MRIKRRHIVENTEYNALRSWKECKQKRNCDKIHPKCTKVQVLTVHLILIDSYLGLFHNLHNENQRWFVPATDGANIAPWPLHRQMKQELSKGKWNRIAGKTAILIRLSNVSEFAFRDVCYSVVTTGLQGALRHGFIYCTIAIRLLARSCKQAYVVREQS